MTSMEPTVQIEKISPYRDIRGIVFEPVDPTSLADVHNIHIVITNPGGVRGNHYHRIGTEILAVTGPAHIRLRRSGNIEDIDVDSEAIYRLIIPPGISHAIRNTGTKPNILVALNSIAFDPENPDVVSDLLFE